MSFRLCVDLNVWVGQFLAEAKGLKGTTSQAIVEIVQDGRSGIRPVQLVVSYTMLSRLQDVLARMGASLDTSKRFIELIATFARIGPAPEHPRVILGGGVEPTVDSRSPRYDPYDPGFEPRRSDPEDGRVLDTAIAGRAHALVTANLRDFVRPDDPMIVTGRVYRRHTADHDLYILRPADMLDWLRTGREPHAE